MNRRFSIALVATAFFSAFFIDTAIDIARWFYCAFLTDNGCKPESSAYRTAGFAGLAVGSMFAVVGVFLGVRGREKSRREAVGLILTVLAGGLISILKIATDPKKRYPLLENMDVALGFYVAVFALLLLPVRIKGDAAFLTVGRVAIAVIYSMLASVLVFEYLTPAIHVIFGFDESIKAYILKPYAVAITSSAFAVLAAAAWHVPNRTDVPRLFFPAVISTAIPIAALYGTTPDLVVERGDSRSLGALIGVLHLCLPMLIAALLLTTSTIGVRLILTICVAVLVGVTAWWLIGLLPYSTNINVAGAALDFAIAFVIAVVCASLAVRSAYLTATIDKKPPAM